MPLCEIRARTGFALPAVLAVTGVVTIVFLVAMTALYSLNAEAASARARVRFIQRAMTTEASLAYMMSTEPSSLTGVNIGAVRNQDSIFGPSLTGEKPEAISSGLQAANIHLDGRPYLLQSGGPLIIDLRDQGGMINLAYLLPEQTERLMQRLGASRGFDATVRARFLDYVDADSLRQPGGAERADYPEATGPANRDLRRPDEWLSILGVRRAVSSRQWRALRDDIVVDHTLARINLNTARPAVLEILFGATPQQAAAAVRAREQTPFQTFAQFSAASGVLNLSDPEAVYTFPTGRVVVTLRDGLSPWIYKARISLTPDGMERPVWIDQTDMLEAPGRVAADTKNAIRFPYAPR